MFDITSSKLLILGIVALLVIGPKDLPALLRTIGKYMGIIKRHAADFRAQFDEAIRESELDQLKKEVETIGQETEATMRAAEQTVHKELADSRHEVESALATDAKPVADPMAHDADGLPVAGSDGAVATPVPMLNPVPVLNGAAPHAEATPAETAPTEATPEPGRAPEKSGA